MRPDAPREDFAAAFRALSAVMHRCLPRRVDLDAVLLPWETTAPLLLARMARQGETLALLTEHGHELDAEIVMRSLLEHLTLFGWLAIAPDDHTEWWMVAQFHRDKQQTGDIAREFPGFLTPELQAGLRAVSDDVKRRPNRGVFPNVLQMATAVDAHWSTRLDGWGHAERGDRRYVVTFRGHYWTLYYQGSTSTHPHYGRVRDFVTAPSRGGYQRPKLEREVVGPRVRDTLSIAVYLMADALALAEAALGWDGYDDALRILNRWNEVRGSRLLWRTAQAELGRRRRRWGRTSSSLIREQVIGSEYALTVASAHGWWRLRHDIGTDRWRVDADGEVPRAMQVRGDFELGPVIAEARSAIGDVDWIARKPAAWPASAQ